MIRFCQVKFFSILMLFGALSLTLASTPIDSEISPVSNQNFMVNYFVPRYAIETFSFISPQQTQKADQVFAEAEALKNRGTGESYRAAIEKYLAAAKFFQAEENKALEALSWLAAGFLNNLLGEKQKALEYYNQALPLIRAVGEPHGEAAILNNIGLVYSELGEKQKALEYYNQALPLIRTVRELRGEAATLNNIGLVYSSLGEKQKALEYYNQALLLMKAIGDRKSEAVTLNNIGLVYCDLGEKKKALEYYNQALPLMKAIGDRSGEAVTLNNLGGIYDDLGEKQKALEYYNQSLVVRRTVGDRRGEAATLNNIGSMYDDLGEKKKALEYYNQALPLMKAIGDRRGEAATLNNLSFLFRRDNPHLAIYYGKQSVNLLQSLRADIQGLDRSLQQSFLKSVGEAYSHLAGLLIEQGRLPEAERVNEMLKDEEYFEYTRRDQKVASALKLRSDLTPAERKAVEEYSRIAEQLTIIGKELDQLEAARLRLPETASFPQQARLTELKSQLASASTAMTLFQQQLAEDFKKVKETPPENVSAWKAGLQRWGGAGTVMIYTVTQEEKLYVIVTTNKTQEAHQIDIKAADLNKLVAEFRAALTDPCACRDVFGPGQKLYDVLVKPIEGDLKGADAKTLLWWPSGTLRYVPMAALWDGKQYLAERFVNVLITKESRDKLGIASQNVKEWRGLGLGVSQQWKDFPALSAVPEELQRIIRQEKETTGVVPGRRLLDKDFTKDALDRALGRYSVIHIASHFSFQPGAQKSSYLLLGDGSPFTIEAVENSTPMFTNVDLLALSACNTAMSGDSNGREVEGFGALAQQHGALSVLATLWAVSDESTGELMSDFYRRETTMVGMTKGEALRQSQVEMMKGEGTGTRLSNRQARGVVNANVAGKPFKPESGHPIHPYYWAPFILIGNWQ